MTTTNLLKSINSKLEQITVPAPEVMTPEQAAKYLGVEATFLLRNKNIVRYQPSTKIVRFRKADLDKWLNAHRVKTQSEIESQASSILRRKAK